MAACRARGQCSLVVVALGIGSRGPIPAWPWRWARPALRPQCAPRDRGCGDRGDRLRLRRFPFVSLPRHRANGSRPLCSPCGNPDRDGRLGPSTRRRSRPWKSIRFEASGGGFRGLGTSEDYPHNVFLEAAAELGAVAAAALGLAVLVIVLRLVRLVERSGRPGRLPVRGASGSSFFPSSRFSFPGISTTTASSGHSSGSPGSPVTGPLWTRKGRPFPRHRMNEQTRIDFPTFLSLIGRRKKLLIAITAMAAALALGASLLQDERYEASSKVLFEKVEFGPTLFGSPQAESPADPAREAATHLDIVSLEAVTRRVSATTRQRAHARGARGSRGRDVRGPVGRDHDHRQRADPRSSSGARRHVRCGGGCLSSRGRYRSARPGDHGAAATGRGGGGGRPGTTGSSSDLEASRGGAGGPEGLADRGRGGARTSRPTPPSGRTSAASKHRRGSTGRASARHPAHPGPSKAGPAGCRRGGALGDCRRPDPGAYSGGSD